jgi:hypothetical protein
MSLLPKIAATPFTGAGKVWEVEAAIGSRLFRLVEDHRVAFPLQPVLDVQLFEQLQHVWVSPKKDVQPGFVPVAIFILPRQQPSRQGRHGIPPKSGYGQRPPNILRKTNPQVLLRQ